MRLEAWTRSAMLLGVVLTGCLKEADDSDEVGSTAGAVSVTWQNLVGVSASGNSLTKTAPESRWNAGASSVETLAEDGYVEFTTAENTSLKMAGLSAGDNGASYKDIDYAIFLKGNGVVAVYEAGVLRIRNATTYAAGDLFRVDSTGGVVTYAKNGTVFYTSSIPAPASLGVDTSLYTPGATIDNVVLVSTDYWQNAVGVSHPPHELTKTDPLAAWNAGAASVQQIAGDGYVEFTSAENTTQKMAGLSHGDSARSYKDIDFAVYLRGNRTVGIYEDGIARGSNFTTYAPGDVFRVEAAGGVVTYSKNGVPFFTSPTAPTFPLLVDTSLYTPGATIKAVALAELPPPALDPPPCAAIEPTGNVLLDLGHDEEYVRTVRRSGTRVLSQDRIGHWNLSDTAARTRVLSGDNGVRFEDRPYRVDMAGGTVLIQTASSIELRAASDGHLLTTISTTAEPVGLASDGSYAWGQSASGLFAWSASGQLLVSQGGNYASAKVFAAPGQLRIALGPAGASVIQRVSTADNTSTTTAAFAGTFHSWFLDGERFLTAASSAVRVYTKDAVSEQLISLTSLSRLAGTGDYFWIVPYLTSGGNTVQIYRVGATTPVASYPLYVGYPLASGHHLALEPPFDEIDTSTNLVDIVDLRGPSPVRTRHPLPVNADELAFGADPTGGWAIGNRYGVVFDSDNLAAPDGPVPLTCGAVKSISGSATGLIAVATMSGQILVIDLASGGRTLRRVLRRQSDKLEMSSDGTVLAARGDLFQAQYAIDSSVRILQLPGGELIHEWDDPYSVQPDFTIARGGTRLGRIRPPNVIVTDLTGSATFAQVTASPAPPMLLNPSGTHFALDDDQTPDAGTLVYEGSTLVGAASGAAHGWIDDSHLLVERYGYDNLGNVVPIGTDICDASGVVLSTLAQTIPLAGPPQLRALGATAVYVPQWNRIYSLLDGSVLWSSSVPFRQYDGRRIADVAGDQVVFLVARLVYMETPP